MTDATQETRVRKDTDRAVIISTDSHVSAPFEQIRKYCPKRYLEDFDSFAGSFERSANPAPALGVDPNLPPQETRRTRRRNVLNQGCPDPHARLRDMDYDGLAAENVFHGLNVGTDHLPMPFH